jgi:hypothetical protein
MVKAKKHLLIEVELKPRVNSFIFKRTLSAPRLAQQPLSGIWLRTTIDMKDIVEPLSAEDPAERLPYVQDVMKKSRKLDEPKLRARDKKVNNLNQEGNKPLGLGALTDIGDRIQLDSGTDKDTSQLPSIPKAREFFVARQDRRVYKLVNKHVFVPYYQVIGLEDNLIELPIPTIDDSEVGHYSKSRLGCSGSVYVRDFAHMILQYRLPRFFKEVSLEGAILWSKED